MVERSLAVERGRRRFGVRAAVGALVVAVVGTVLAVTVLPTLDAQTQTNNPATGRPRILASQVGAPILFADPFDIADADGLPYTGNKAIGDGNFDYSYQWIRVNDDNTSTNIGTDSPSYHLVDDDIGKLIIVQVSFDDEAGNAEVVTSLPFGPIRRRPVDSSLTPSTLVSNTGQAATDTSAAQITQQYAASSRWAATARAMRSPASRSSWARSRPTRIYRLAVAGQPYFSSLGL